MRLDGGLATTLQRVGLPPYAPVEPWLLTRPDAVLEAHRAFVRAGTTDLLAATFRCLPGLTPGWQGLRERAVELGRQAGAERLWLTLGPGGDCGAAARGAAVDGVVLETRTDPAEAVAAARQVRAVWAGPLVVSLVPGPDGELPGGLGRAAEALRRVGVDGLGLNCAPVAVLTRAVARLDTALPLWLKPSGPDLAGIEALVERAGWIGGCCGVGPEQIAALGPRGPEPLSGRSPG